MKIVNDILTKNPCYTAGKKITVKGLMLHSVGCPQPNASVFVKSWNKSSYDKACVHAFIDANTGYVHQCLPWNHRGWHGGGTSNNTHIGVEMCEPDCIKYTGGSKFTVLDKEKAQEMVKRTYESAVELFAMLCKEYNLNPITDIVGHAEGNKLGIASNHADPEHLWKGVGLPYTMDTFRGDVKNSMGENKTSKEEFMEEIASYVDKYKNQFGICVTSAIVAQACKESAFGTSELAIKANNIFGIKLKNNRTPIAIGGYNKDTKEEYKVGELTTVNACFAKFASWEDCVIGYFQFITSSSRYNNLKGVTDEEEYCHLIKKDGYATGSNYDNSLINDYIKKYNLTRFDNVNEGFKPYLVKITALVLNVRKGAGTNYPIKTVVLKGQVYTIVEESKDGKWGKLKSGAGWISLAYTKKR